MNHIFINDKLLCIARFISRLIHKDERFIQGIIEWNRNPDVLTIEHLGEQNSKGIVYIIKEQGSGYGFFAEFRCLLADLLYADSLGLIPCIIYGDNYLYYEKAGVNGELNAFDYYFKLKNKIVQPFQSKNVVYSEPYHAEYIAKKYDGMGYKTSDYFEEKLAEMFIKYIDIKPDILLRFEEQILQMFENKKVLGIHYRGTDFKVGYNVHPVEVKLEQDIVYAKDAIKNKQFNYIFLATDEQGVFEVFQQEFGDIVKCYNDVYRGSSTTSVAFSHSERKNHHYLLGLEVLRDAYTLSRCEGLIAGVSQVSFGAKIFKRSREETYEYIKIVDNGVNCSKKEFKVPTNYR